MRDPVTACMIDIVLVAEVPEVGEEIDEIFVGRYRPAARVIAVRTQGVRRAAGAVIVAI